MGNIFESALELAPRGIASFPCNNEKRPTCPHGFKDATANPQQLGALCRDFPGNLIGVPTGALNGFDVLDIDAKHTAAREWWNAHREGLMPTRAHRTRSGGLHVLFKHTSGIKCSAGKLALGVDIRTTGGYVIWWPAAGYPVLSDGPIAEFPVWLIEALRPPPPPSRKTVPIIAGDRRALQGLVRAVISAKEGERNRIIFWASCRAAEMIDAGHLNEGEVIAELTAAATYTGLSEREAVRTINSGLETANR